MPCWTLAPYSSSVEIVVPHNLAASSGKALECFSPLRRHKQFRDGASVEPPVLVVRGGAVFGSVEIRTSAPACMHPIFQNWQSFVFNTSLAAWVPLGAILGLLISATSTFASEVQNGGGDNSCDGDSGIRLRLHPGIRLPRPAP